MQWANEMFLLRRFIQIKDIDSLLKGDIAKARIYVSLYGAHTQFQWRGILMVSQRNSEFHLFLIDPRDLANIVLLYYYLRAYDGPIIEYAYTTSKFITSRTVPV